MSPQRNSAGHLNVFTSAEAAAADVDWQTPAPAQVAMLHKVKIFNRGAATLFYRANAVADTTSGVPVKTGESSEYEGQIHSLSLISSSGSQPCDVEVWF